MDSPAGARPAAQVGRYGPLVHIPRFDVAPDELTWQLPINGELYRRMSGPDRPDYSLVVLRRPLHFYPQPGFDVRRVDPEQRVPDRKGRPMVRVHALLVCTRFVGHQLQPGMVELPVNVAYVIDNSLARDEQVDFAKVELAGVGFLSEGHGERTADRTSPAATTAATTAEAAPAEPAPAEAAPVESAPVESAPVESAPAEAAPAEAAPAEAAPAEAAPVEPAPVEPAPVEPAPAEPAPNLGQQRPGAAVAQEVARVLRQGIEDQRGYAVRQLTATLTVDGEHRLTGLTGNADGEPPAPTTETFARLNDLLARLAQTPDSATATGVRVRIDSSGDTSELIGPHT